MRLSGPLSSVLWALVAAQSVCGELRWSDARPRRHADSAPATVAATNASDEFRQLVSDKGRSSKGASRHHATPLDAWPEKCARPAKCEPLINATCFGAPLPYSHTTVELANDSSSQFEIQV
ncbi:hypothetical protein MTO96_036045 [Rhipicephalus appendiculatus]